MSSDAYHVTAPDPQGTGGVISMKRALNDAGASMTDISFVSAHAAGTRLGDPAEIRAIEQLQCESKSFRFDESSFIPVPVVSMKGALGHLLGAAGSVETALAILCMQQNECPGNTGLEVPLTHNRECVSLPRGGTSSHLPKDRTAYFLKNSFGFGGDECNSNFSNVTNYGFLFTAFSSMYKTRIFGLLPVICRHSYGGKKTVYILIYTLILMLRRDWDATKASSIDWNNCEEILAHRFTFLDIVTMHPPLLRKLGLHEKLFGDSNGAKDTGKVLEQNATEFRRNPKGLIQLWIDEKLFVLRKARWCFLCGHEGHTMQNCITRMNGHPFSPSGYSDVEYPTTRRTADAVAHQGVKAAPSIKELIVEQTQRHVESLKTQPKRLAQERDAKRSAPPGSWLIEPFSRKTFHRGTIVSVNDDPSRRDGTVKDVESGYCFRFASSQVENFGLKQIKENDLVQFRIDQRTTIIAAKEVTPIIRTWQDSDAEFFFDTCLRENMTLILITRILVHQEHWNALLQYTLNVLHRKPYYLSTLLAFMAKVALLGIVSVSDSPLSSDPRVSKQTLAGNTSLVRLFFKEAILPKQLSKVIFQSEEHVSPTSHISLFPDLLCLAIERETSGVYVRSTNSLSNQTSSSQNSENDSVLETRQSIAVVVPVLGILRGMRKIFQEDNTVLQNIVALLQYMETSLPKYANTPEYMRLVRSTKELLNSNIRSYRKTDAIKGPNCTQVASHTLKQAQNLPSTTLDINDICFNSDDERSPLYFKNLGVLSNVFPSTWDHLFAHYSLLRADCYNAFIAQIHNYVSSSEKRNAQILSTDQTSATENPKVKCDSAFQSVCFGGYYFDSQYGICPVLRCDPLMLGRHSSHLSRGNLVCLLGTKDTDYGLKRAREGEHGANVIDRWHHLLSCVVSVCSHRGLVALRPCGPESQQSLIADILRVLGCSSSVDAGRLPAEGACRIESFSGAGVLLAHDNFFPSYEPVLQSLHRALEFSNGDFFTVVRHST